MSGEYIFSGAPYDVQQKFVSSVIIGELEVRLLFVNLCKARGFEARLVGGVWLGFFIYRCAFCDVQQTFAL